jgi:hypothetical protein
MKGMAPEDAAHGHKKPPEDPIFPHRLVRVNRTGGHISATGWVVGGNRVLIKADTLENKPKQRFPYIRYDCHHIGNSRQTNDLNKPAFENKSLS